MEKEQYEQELQKLRDEQAEFRASILKNLTGNADGWSDEVVQKKIDERVLADFFETKVHNGRYGAGKLLTDGTIKVTLHSFHTVIERRQSYAPIELHLSPETFSFLLEVMQHAARRFNIDVRENVSVLANGQKIQYRDTISDFIIS